MEGNLSNNKKIAKNTAFLYLRMFISIGIGLFTSRVVLEILGIEDFGIYNIVGGVVVVFSFINASLRNATERFMSFGLGKREDDNFIRIYNLCIECHYIIIFILLILLETVGLGILHNFIEIPYGRQNIVDIVYQLSVITFVINILQVPFQSAIISFEKLDFYAWLSILETVLRLIVVYLLIASPLDKLISYSVLMLIISVFVLISYYLYCSKILKLGNLIIIKDTKLLKSILKFASFSMVNGSVSMISFHGGNILLNSFFGVAVNAATGIANQVSQQLYAFVSNFQSAFQPQIVKLYAAKDYSPLIKLIYRSSLVSIYLMLLVSIPILFNLDYILNIWLVTVPDQTEIFCVWLILYFILDSLQAPLWMLIYGSGDIRNYTLYTALIALSVLPITFFFLYYGYPPYILFVVRFFANIICSIYRTIYIKKYLTFSLGTYLIKVILRVFFVCIIVLAIHYLVVLFIQDNLHPIVNIIMSLFVTLSVITIIGFDYKDRIIIYKIIKERIFRK